MNSASFVIDHAVAEILTAPLVTPFRIATGQHDELENVFFRVKTADGLYGYGEAAVASHITGETVAATLENLKSAARDLKGRRIEDVAAACRDFAPVFTGNHAGLAALEMALFDVAARTQGVPLHRLFTPVTGKAPMLAFSTDITVVIGSIEEARVTARDYAGRNFNSFKIKIGRDEELDLKRVLAVHEVVPRGDIILDANMGFTAGRMLAFMERLEANGVRPVLLEQPVQKHDWDGLAEITAALAGTPTVVCADESVGSLEAARRAVDSRAVTGINIKLMKSGIVEGIEIARLAAANGIHLMLGAMMESSLAITASAHFAAGLGCFEFIDLDTTFFLKGEMAHSPYLDDCGWFDLGSAGSGIGVERSLP